MKTEIEAQNNSGVVLQNKFDSSYLPEGMMRDCFVALTMSIMGEYFISGDTKYFIFHGMIGNLEKMWYSTDGIEKFKDIVSDFINK